MNERQIKLDKVEGPQGKWEVSTIRTDAGGAPPRQPLGSPFSTADYTDETPWPFETIVFKGGSRGYYHRAYNTKAAALEGHREITTAIEAGTLDIGAGVRGVFGVPSLTPEDWANGLMQGPQSEPSGATND